MRNSPRLLVIEDSDSKYSSIDTLLRSKWGHTIFIERAATITDAETKIELETWSVIILDVSMDIVKSVAGPKQGGHATLGGLNIATKMFLLEREAPTVIVTAFDSFEAVESDRGRYEALGLEEVKSRASDTLGTALIGCVRYGDPGWEEQLIGILEGIIQ